MCYLTLKHKEKQKVCRFFVVPQNSPALLDMPDTETLGVLTIADKIIGRQVASCDNADKRQRNCQC